MFMNRPVVVCPQDRQVASDFECDIGDCVAGSAVFKGGNAEAYRGNMSAIRNAALGARGEVA